MICSSTSDTVTLTLANTAYVVVPGAPSEKAIVVGSGSIYNGTVSSAQVNMTTSADSKNWAVFIVPSNSTIQFGLPATRIPSSHGDLRFQSTVAGLVVVCTYSAIPDFVNP